MTAGGRNRWRRIAEELRRGIVTGRYAPGDRLPTSPEIQARYGVSNQTVQHAMNALRDEGLLATRPGLGWFVREPTQVIRLVRRSEPAAGRVVVAVRTCCHGTEPNDWQPGIAKTQRSVNADGTLAAELGIAPGDEVFVRERTMSDDGEIVALTSSYIPRSLSRGTVIEAVETGPGGVFMCLVALGHRVTRHVEHVTAGPAEDDEMHRFGRVDRPFIVRIARATLSEDTVLAVFHVAFLAGRFELCYDLPIPPPRSQAA